MSLCTKASIWLKREYFFYSGNIHLKYSGWKQKLWRCVCKNILHLVNYWIYEYCRAYFFSKYTVDADGKGLCLRFTSCSIKLGKGAWICFPSYSSAPILRVETVTPPSRRVFHDSYPVDICLQAKTSSVVHHWTSRYLLSWVGMEWNP